MCMLVVFGLTNLYFTVQYFVDNWFSFSPFYFVHCKCLSFGLRLLNTFLASSNISCRAKTLKFNNRECQSNYKNKPCQTNTEYTAWTCYPKKVRVREQLFSYIMERPSYIGWDYNDVRFALDQHVKLLLLQLYIFIY